MVIGRCHLGLHLLFSDRPWNWLLSLFSCLRNLKAAPFFKKKKFFLLTQISPFYFLVTYKTCFSFLFLSHWNMFLWFVFGLLSTLCIKKKMDTTVAILDAWVRLTHEVSKLAIVKSQLPRHQYKSRSPSPHHRRYSNKPGLCFYHSHFGSEARTCRMLYSFSNQGNLNLESWAWHNLHKIYVTTVPILSQTPGPMNVVWLTQGQLAVSSHWSSSLRSRQCCLSHCKQ